MGLIDSSIAALWNSWFWQSRGKGLAVGSYIEDGKQAIIPERRRPEHIAILGKTGTGKSTLLKYLMSQDVRERHGFVCIDLHGDLIPFVLSEIAAKERSSGQDISSRVLIIDPSDPKHAVGLNLIESEPAGRTLHISEMVTLLRQRWSLDHFGA